MNAEDKLKYRDSISDISDDDMCIHFIELLKQRKNMCENEDFDMSEYGTLLEKTAIIEHMMAHRFLYVNGYSAAGIFKYKR